MIRFFPLLLAIACIDASEPASLRQSDYFGSADATLSLSDIVRGENPYDGVHTWDDYRRLLGELKQPRYRVLTMAAFAKAGSDPQSVTVGMRHDSDSHPEKMVAMAAIEDELHIPSTYYILHSAAYYGRVVDGRMIRHAAITALAQDLHRRGFEIGIHTDLFQMMWKHNFDPVGFMQAEIADYAKLGIPVTGAAAHGDSEVIRRKLNNMWIFAEFGKRGDIEVNGRLYPYGLRTVAEHCLAYEAYLLKPNESTGDIDGRLTGKGVAALIALLAGIPPGQRVIILTHPEHWGRTVPDATP